MSASEIAEASAKILKVEARIEELEEKIEGREQSYPASVRPAEVTVELEQLRKRVNILQEELVELLKCKNILLTRGASSSAAAGSLSATPSGLSHHFARQAEVLQVAVHDVRATNTELKSTILKLEKGIAEAKEEATKAKEEAAKANGQIAIMERRQLDGPMHLKVQ